MGVVNGIMSLAASIVIMDMAMAVDRFDDDADGMRMCVRCQHRAGEKRRENDGDDRHKPWNSALMHGGQIAPAWLRLAEGVLRHLIEGPVMGNDGLSMATVPGNQRGWHPEHFLRQSGRFTNALAKMRLSAPRPTSAKRSGNESS